MNNGGDAAEQIIKLYLEGFEVVAKLTGSGAKNLYLMLAATLKQESKTKGKARLTNMIKSGKELKVFSIQNKDLKNSPSRLNAMVFFIPSCVTRTVKLRTLPLILLPVQMTLLKFRELLTALNLARLIRLPLLRERKRLLLTVKRLRLRSLQSQRASLS